MKDAILAYNALCTAQASLERMIDASMPEHDVHAMRDIRYALVGCRERMVPFAFPGLYPREMPNYGSPLPAPTANGEVA